MDATRQANYGVPASVSDFAFFVFSDRCGVISDSTKFTAPIDSTPSINPKPSTFALPYWAS